MQVLLHLTQGHSLCFGCSLRISPFRTQFLKKESLTLSCGADGTPDGKLQTNSSSQTCSEKIHTCNITMAGAQHSGAYWCAYNSGQQGEVVHITVADGSVILESPVHPVPEGASVRLRCLKVDQSCSKCDVTPKKQSCTFSRDGQVIEHSLTGEMNVTNLSRADEGVYTCNISGDQSPGSWLAVKASHMVSLTTTTPRSPPHHLIPLAYIGLLLLLLFLLILLGVVGVYCWRRRCKASPGPSQTDWTLGPGDEAADLWCRVINTHRMNQLSPHTLRERAAVMASCQHLLWLKQLGNAPINRFVQHLPVYFLWEEPSNVVTPDNSTVYQSVKCKRGKCTFK
ncbi:Low affinity immunoglobulin gamma Fc region receptor III [Merluccius polli]|nr:Low affinity immunoglobulin gamma Fc region receptor III [Merluccius polli]